MHVSLCIMHICVLHVHHHKSKMTVFKQVGEITIILYIEIGLCKYYICTNIITKSPLGLCKANMVRIIAGGQPPQGKNKQQIRNF